MTVGDARLPVAVVAGLCEGARRAAIGDIYPAFLALADGEEETDDADHTLLAQLTPAARHIRVGQGTLGTALLAGFDLTVAAARRHPSCALLPQEADEHGVATLAWHRDRPLHPQRLYQGMTRRETVPDVPPWVNAARCHPRMAPGYAPVRSPGSRGTVYATRASVPRVANPSLRYIPTASSSAP